MKYVNNSAGDLFVYNYSFPESLYNKFNPISNTNNVSLLICFFVSGEVQYLRDSTAKLVYLP